MQLDIITPDKNLFSGDATELVVPGVDGFLGILNNHAPLISALAKGSIKVSTGNGVENYDVNGGVIEVKDNKVIILAE